MNDDIKKGNATIKSIAQELGISFSTVSKALNNNTAVKEETRNIVLKKAQEMGYAPNTLAQGLRNRSTKTIAVIFNDIENPALTYIFKNIAIEMSKYGYTTLICDSQFSKKTERSNIASVLARQPDFIILEPTTTDPENLALLAGISNRLILQGARYDNINSHQVHVDYEHGGYVSACELLSKRHRDILIITEPLDFPISRQYVNGIKRAYKEFGIPFNPDRIKTTHACIQNGFTILCDLWNTEKSCFTIPFTGVLTFCDTLAHGVYKAVTQFGLQVPKDISVIGFDDNPLSAFSAPPLTTVHLPKEKMAESCIKILQSVLIKKRTETHIYSLEPYLITRNSVKDLSLEEDN